ncbi:MAG: APC family permease [Dehalococcoidia bacterium]|nr:APC family permease [Dehalococcoidia bacterium]
MVLPGSDNDPPNTPSDSGLEWKEVIRGAKPGDQVIRIARQQSFRTVRPGLIVPRPPAPKGYSGRILSNLGRTIFGTPLPSAAELSERVGIPRGLSLFASDNISSSAYATEEIMRVLIMASVSALTLTVPITLAIILILAIVVLSDRVVIATYPGGGGSYIVAYENLGPIAGLVAAAALLTDYVLTVAVSVSAGIAALTSAFPGLHDRRVLFAVIVIALMTIVNLRGVRESGKVFMAPTYVYLLSVLSLVAFGMYRLLTGDAPEYQAPQEWTTAHTAAPLTLLLVFRAFASGSVALTGVEAVSNGVPSFQQPEVRNAQTTLIIMGALFATIFAGLSFLAGRVGVVPDPHEVETVLSQIARAFTGQNWFYYLLQFSTALLLVLAGNTAFNGFPRLASILAQDRYLPRQFMFRGDRLAFTSGIIVLSLTAALLVWVYEGSVTNLIPLYTVGVFIAFTLSQTGLVRRWWLRRREERSWVARLAVNGVGAAATGGVAIVIGVSKFALGAWMVMVLIPILVGVMWAIHRHYLHLAEASTPETPLDPRSIHLRVVVPIANLGLPARQALAYAQAIAALEQIIAVHVAEDEERADKFRRSWQEFGMQAPLVIIESPFRSLTNPLIAYIDAVRDTHPSDTVTVILPEYVPRRWWEHLIHNQTALRLKAALLFHPGIVVIDVPYHLRD